MRRNDRYTQAKFSFSGLTLLQLFTSSVNSPIKISQAPKDASGIAPIGTRKTSISGYGAGSRPGTRRRDTSDSFTANGPMSPIENKSFFRGESSAATPPAALLRRRTDFKDDEPSPDQKDSAAGKEPDDVQAPIGSLRRTNGPLSAGLNPPSNSPWSAGPGSSAFGSMGSFGSFNTAQPSSGQDKPDQRPGFGSARGASRFKDLLSKSSTEDIQAASKEKNAFGSLAKLPEEDHGLMPGAASGSLRTRPNRSETNPYEEMPNRTGSAALSSQGEAIGDPANFGSIGRSQAAMNENASPATNPYQSPYGARDDGQEGEPQALPPFGATRRALFGDDGAPRSAGGFGGFPGFGAPGAPGAPNWSSAGLGSGTPARDRSMGFGDSIFSPITDMQSPGAGLGSGFFGGGFGSVGRNNRLGGMLPTAMDDPRTAGRLFDRPDSASRAMRDPFDNGFARASGAFEDAGLGGRAENEQAFRPSFQGEEAGPISADRGTPDSESAQHTPTSGADYQMPTAQQRQMVMPDRMRWIYRDPQGNVQGPWSGLEMHDWFKAGFFTAELLVKKVEDTDFEPLAQLVRRIGNSREPFLVPQIGVPHGPAPSANQAAWPSAAPPATGNTNTGANNSNNNSQPPFASAFPSFGTTLTAEQQNALERRKQEEQYLMARQKEHLAQQQLMAKQMHMQGQPHGMHSLQHQPSAHSLHSQPSYGSITSPGAGYHPSPAPMGSHAPIGQPHFGREDELPGFMDRMNLNQRGGPLGAPGDQQQLAQMMQDRAQLQQQSLDTRAHQEAFLGQQGRNERLEEFQELRGQPESGRPGPESVLAPIGAQRTSEEASRAPVDSKKAPIGQSAQRNVQIEPPSLTEQVQWTTAQQHDKPIQAPPVSISPLPAPAAQRNRQHVADSLAAESRSQSQTPVDTPATSVAPWAERNSDAPRGPSLREIQEAEAKKAAEQAAVMDAARRAHAEQERLAESSIIPPAPGLPATATWGTSSSPGTPTAAVGSVWAKPVVKTSTATNGPAKKTLAQIQKEEEARKQRAAAQVQVQSADSPASVGKRYAELASKAAPVAPAAGMTNAAWTTVGSGGKSKPPPTILATPQATPRTVSSTAATTLKPRPSLPASKGSSMGEKTKAHEEFMKWLKGALGKGLNSGINGESSPSPNLCCANDRQSITLCKIY